MPDAELIKRVAIHELAPSPKNARTHSESQIAQIMASIREFGFTNPILVNAKGLVIAGHGRLEAARRLGMPDVPTIALSHLTAAQQRAYTIADNQLALNAGWEDDLLKSELLDLQALDFDLDLLGFGADDLANLLSDKTEGLTDPDETPDIAETAVSQPGDIWNLGRHRIACGDSTDPATVTALLGTERPHLMVTDPPYGVEYDANWRNERLKADGSPTNGTAIGKVKNDDVADWSPAWALFPGNVAYVWCSDLHNPIVAQSIIASGFELRSQIIWAKGQFAISRGNYHWQHEACWYAVRKGKTAHWTGDRKQTTLWHIDKPRKSETGHSTQKPVECMKRPMENNSRPGDAVYEPFSGSGTTIIAAEMAGRRCLAIELSPLYVDMAVRRWQAFSGGVATLAGSGKTFAEVEHDRAG